MASVCTKLFEWKWMRLFVARRSTQIFFPFQFLNLRILLSKGYGTSFVSSGVVMFIIIMYALRIDYLRSPFVLKITYYNCHQYLLMLCWNLDVVITDFLCSSCDIVMYYEKTVFVIYVIQMKLAMNCIMYLCTPTQYCLMREDIYCLIIFCTTQMY
jgi:hypothetical protein